MNNHEEKISSIGRSLLNRRGFMKNAGFSTGALGLAQLLSKDGLFGSDDPTSFTGKSPIRPNLARLPSLATHSPSSSRK